MNTDLLLAHHGRIADSPDAIPRLRRFVLDLAVRGRLVHQNLKDAPASQLLQQIAADQARMQKTIAIRKENAIYGMMAHDSHFAVPTTWEWTRIANVAYVVMGQSPSSEHYNQAGHGVPFFQGKADFGKQHPTPRYWCTQPRKYALPGDILISIRAPVGPTNLANERCCIGRGLAALHPHNGVDRYYLLLCLKAFEHRLGTLGFGTTFVAINKVQLSSFSIPLPPSDEQQRIVAKVDELMALCDQLEASRTERETARDKLATVSLTRLNAPDPDPDTFRNHAAFVLENLTPLTTRPDQIRALRKTILNLAVRGQLVEQDKNDESAEEKLGQISLERDDLVRKKYIRRQKPLAKMDDHKFPFSIPHNWCWTRIGEVALFTQYGTSIKSMSSDHGVPVLTMGNIQDGQIVFRSEKKIPEDSEEFPGLFLRKFDLLYNRTNSAELVGKTGIYLGENNCRTFASYLIRIRMSLMFSSPRYVNLAMNAPAFRETQIVPLIKKQTGQANVNGTALKHMLLPLPPLAEQHRIVAKTNELMALCDRLEESLATRDDTHRRLLEAELHDVLARIAEPKISTQKLGE